MKTKRQYKQKTFLGINNGKKIYLTAPSWDCGWYWGFGYLGNKDCHYHVDSMEKDVPFYEKFEKHFGSTFIVRPSQKYLIAELFKTFYSLKETAEVLGRGGSHITSNPCKEIIKNESEVKRINEIVLPAIFDEIYKILESNAKNESLFDELIEIYELGFSNVVEFMFKNKLTPDDIKHLTGLNWSGIRSEYYKQLHAKK